MVVDAFKFLNERVQGSKDAARESFFSFRSSASSRVSSVSARVGSISARIAGARVVSGSVSGLHFSNGSGKQPTSNKGLPIKLGVVHENEDEKSDEKHQERHQLIQQEVMQEEQQEIVY